jgi:arylsulfatase A-like enzyme
MEATMSDSGSGPNPVRMPRNAIVVLLDSLNRHMLGCYGGREFDTPNLDAFAARAVRFDRNVTGSLPCMPARHDILTGALDFLWRPWDSTDGEERAIWTNGYTASRLRRNFRVNSSDRPRWSRNCPGDQTEVG